LLYVGITRAKDVVYLTWAARRMLYGSGEYMAPSRFLADIPRELLEGTPPTRSGAMRDWQSYREMTTWDSGSTNGAVDRTVPGSASRTSNMSASGSAKRASFDGSAYNPAGKALKKAVNSVGDGAAAFVPKSGLTRISVESTRQPNFRSGQRITHEKFGEGTVITSAIRGDVEELEVRFADKRFGFKKLSAEFVKPVTG